MGGGTGYAPIYLHAPGRAFHACLLARAHVSKPGDSEWPAGRTLFLLNVPAAASAPRLHSAFSAAVGEVGRLALCEVGEAHAPVRAAHVAFAAPESLKKALRLRRALELPEEETRKGGAARRESREQMQRTVDAFMRKFDAAQARREAEEAARHNTMDADGFVVVSRKRGRSTATEESTGATVGVASKAHELHESATSKKKKKKNKGELVDFYHFQQHERKREQLAKLREQFEADKARIAKMKQERKFKPMGY
ncbi:hypothetical protein AB1Y20_021993 [Prymnesium parvum]|uniref:Ribosomal RNA-processing protein 7 C-terminal domain-containing protein n=1 Tax=Prymnesium parvum TaxID=97485 RepID=A0AB34JGK2_PRYPA